MVKDNEEKERIGVIDWGLSRIDFPLLDFAHLLGNFSDWYAEDELKESGELYYDIATRTVCPHLID